MKLHRCWPIAGFCLLLAASATPTWAAPSFGHGHVMTAGADASATYYDFKSAINGQTYRLFVSIPAGAPPKEGFSVLYLLDGNWFFLAAAPNAGLRSDPGVRSYLGELRPSVVVGIGLPTDHYKEMFAQRTRNLTTPIPPARLEMLRRTKPDLYPGNRFGGDSIGGMDDFLRVIEKEIKPFVAGLAPINSHDQALFGHSLGGLTVLHALFTEPAAFQTFVASSPSIWWDENAVLHDELGFSAQVTAGRAAPRLLVEVGALEEGEHAPAHMVTNAVALGARLAKLKGASGYMVKTVVFPDEAHLTVMPAATSRALTFALAETPKEPAKKK